MTQCTNIKNEEEWDLQKKYVIGLDYGTLSGRAVVVDCENGEVLSSSVKNYAHGVMSEELPTGKKLPAGDWALEAPEDYIDVLVTTVTDAVKKSGVAKEDIIGMGMDFTSCTILPIDKDMRPLCSAEEFKDEPHAYVKLWKHHGAQPQADRITELLEKRGEINKPQYGGKISSELMLPKILQIVEEAPEVYQAADQILEAGDWLTQCMTGSKRRSADLAGYKAMWNLETGYPPKDFLEELNPMLKDLVAEKLSEDIALAGEVVGNLNKEWAEKLNLPEGIPVAATLIDSHAGIPGSGVIRPDQLMLVVGTSSVMLSPSPAECCKEGAVSGARGAIVPGNFVLESGIAAVGDMFGWFVDHMTSEEYAERAKEEGKNLHVYLTEKASELKPGESGIVALDWWNGNKTPYVDGRLSGVLVGCTLNTRPEEIYRALIEATAFGTRKIIELYKEANPAIHTIIASGGIAEKNPLLMQIYADVLDCEIKLSATDQTAALGSAVYAAVAAGTECGGYASVEETANHMSHLKDLTYRPIEANVERYNELFGIYCELVDLFDPEKTSVMTRLSSFFHE